MSNWKCSVTFCQNLPYDPFISAFAVHASICYCRRSPLQHSTAMYAWFFGLPCHSCSGGLLCDLQHIRHMVFRMVCVWMLGRMGTKFPFILKCPRHMTCYVKFCIFFWIGCVQLDTCHKVCITVSGSCEHSEWHLLFLPMCNKPTITSYDPRHHIPITSWSEDTVVAFSSGTVM